MIQSDPRKWEVLQYGTPTQREAFHILKDTEIFSLLQPFDPAHIGTIANDIDIPGSDIDIICCCHTFDTVRAKLTSHFGAMVGYRDHTSSIRGNNVFVATIPTSIPIEVYCESRPITEQLGFRHYLIACRVLHLLGAEAHDRIRELKRGGIKTEPAFALLLGLKGDPYLSILELEKNSDKEILGMIQSTKG